MLYCLYLFVTNKKIIIQVFMVFPLQCLNFNNYCVITTIIYNNVITSHDHAVIYQEVMIPTSSFQKGEYIYIFF